MEHNKLNVNYNPKEDNSSIVGAYTKYDKITWTYKIDVGENNLDGKSRHRFFEFFEFEKTFASFTSQPMTEPEQAPEL